MRRHAPHALAMGKRDVGSDAPTKVSLLSFLIGKGSLRWKISYGPHADGTDRGDPRDAGEAYACQRVLVLLSYRIIIDKINHQPHYGRWFFMFIFKNFLRIFPHSY